MRGAILLICLIILHLDSFAQSRYIRNYSVTEGLSQSEVADIVEDNQGRLFLNTGSVGVDVFDGVEFQKVGLGEEYSSKFILKVFKDLEGEIWFLSNQGMDRFSYGRIEQIDFKQLAEDVTMIYCVEQLDEQTVLIGTNDGLLNVDLNSKECSLFDIGEERLHIYDILTLDDGNILVSTDKGIKSYQGGVLVDMKGSFNQIKSNVFAMAQLESGEIICGQQGGFSLIRDEQMVFHSIPDLGSNSIITTLCSTDGVIYMGTNGSGLYVLNTDGELSSYTERQGLSDGYIWVIHEDRSRNIWLGTSGSGLDILSADYFEVYSPEDGILGDIVYCISEEPKGRMWLGTVQGGISWIEDGSIQTFGTEDGLSHRTVRCFYHANDTMFIGTENGISIFHNGHFQDFSLETGTQDLVVFDIARDERDGSYWFGCKGERYVGPKGGLVNWNGKDIRTYSFQDGLENDEVGTLRFFEDHLYIGTDEGLSTFADGTFKNVNLGTNSCASQVIAIRGDFKGNKWLGTVGGLGLLEGDTYTCFAEDPGIKASMVFFIENQGDSILWVGSAEGLEKIDLHDFYETGQMKTVHFNENNGFYGTECNQNAVYQSSDGSFWFGTIKGAIKYDPTRDQAQNINLPLMIKSVRPQGSYFDWGKEGYDINRVNGLPVALQLSHDLNDIRFDYIGVDPIDPDGVEYSFRLVGQDDEWSEPTKERSIYFSNLAPGQYSFEVKGWKRTDDSKVTVDRFEFEIVPAFWQESGFRIGMLALIVISVFALFYSRLKTLEARQKEKQDFQKQVHEMEMTALRAQMNPHFLFNSLNSVNYFIIKNKKEEASAYLTKFGRLIRTILQNSKEKMVTLEQEMRALELYIEIESLRFDKAFEYVNETSESINLKSYMVPPLLLQPYVENAIWHGLLHLEDRAGKLRLKIEEMESGLSILIEDNGIGRKAAENLKSKTAIQKKSMGMQINENRMRLVEEIYGSETSVEVIDLVNSEGRALGTRVLLTVNYNE